MSDGSAHCPRGEAEKPQQPDKSKTKNISKNWFLRKKNNNDSKNQGNSSVQVLLECQDSGNQSSNLFAASSKINEGIVGPRVQGALARGLASILTSFTSITYFPRRQETAARRKESTVHELEEASTSGAQKSILREKLMVEHSEPTRFPKMRHFWAWYPSKKTKKSIIFVDVNSRMSDSSLESVVTLIGTKPLKSALRSTTGSLPSGNSSVRFSLPEALQPGEKNCTTLRIGKWEIVCEVRDNENSEGWIATWRSLRRTRLCKIVLCLTLGVIVPSFLIVPVLVYEETSIRTISAG